MKKIKDRMGKLLIGLLVISFVGIPRIVFAEEEPTESPSPSPTVSSTPVPTPTPTEVPTPTPTPEPTPEPTKEPPVVSEKPTLQLNKTDVEALPNARITIKAIVSGIDQSKSQVSWSSSNSAVAIVNASTGEVYAKTPGEAIITATLEYDKSITAKCKVVVVTKEDPTTSSEKETTNLNLKSLKVKGYPLNEPFSNSRTEYTVDIPYDAEDITVEVEKASNDVKVEIQGATGLKVGKNEVTITVKDNQGNSKVYKIIVTRESKEESKKNKDDDDENISSHNTSKAMEKPQSTRKNHTLEYVLVTIGCLILFAIGGLGIYFYIKTSTKEKKPKKKKAEKKPLVKGDVEKEKEKENPMIEVVSNEEELLKTIEFKEQISDFKEAEVIQNAVENPSTALGEVEDLFEDE